jgi:hypothetical protein
MFGLTGVGDGAALSGGLLGQPALVDLQVLIDLQALVDLQVLAD